MEASENGFIDEIELLLSMYPEEITFDQKSSELRYNHQNGRFCLRLPSSYPVSALPQAVSAIGPNKEDIRDGMVAIIQKQVVGESCLDAIIAEFSELLDAMETQEHDTHDSLAANTNPGEKTVIIWLHHLLATSKRKQALAPEGASTNSISGITKPGYPGVLLFSGSADVVNSHVQTLKNLRWQAFQIRYEADEKWTLKHGDGIIEVESMGEVVNELEAERKEDFMEAMKMR